MNNFSVLITCASWEERFVKGFDQIQKTDLDRVIIFYYKEYENKTKINREYISEYCVTNNIKHHEYLLSFENPASSWKTIYETIDKFDISNKKLAIDITTMPRETTWIILSMLENKDAEIYYIYHRPEKYNDEWLSRDPGRPRLVYKLSGLSKFGVSTKLVIITGFDTERAKQLINYFEPEYTFLGVQKGDQYSNIAQNILKHETEFKKNKNISLLEIDAYSEDHGYDVVLNQIKQYIDNSNIIMTSLGPKLSAIALYRLHKVYEQISLAYAPSNEFNMEYSSGIGESIIRKL